LRMLSLHVCFLNKNLFGVKCRKLQNQNRIAAVSIVTREKGEKKQNLSHIIAYLYTIEKMLFIRIITFTSFSRPLMDLFSS